MKYTLIISVIAAWIFISCSDNIINDPVIEETTIQGKVENWNHGSKKITLRIHHTDNDSSFLGITDIREDGSFKFVISNDRNIKNMLNIITTGRCTGNINITPSDIKYSDTYIEVLDNTSNVIGYLEKRNFEDNIIPGSFASWYAYADKDGNVSGTNTCISVDSSSADTTIEHYNLNLKKGWNIITGKYDEFRPTKMTFSYSTEELAGGKWYFYTWNDMQSKKLRYITD